jgi:hypothetical protein
MDHVISSQIITMDKKTWTAPVLQTIPVRAALGSAAGSKCDKRGSLSHGSGCKS